MAWGSPVACRAVRCVVFIPNVCSSCWNAFLVPPFARALANHSGILVVVTCWMWLGSQWHVSQLVCCWQLWCPRTAGG